MKNNETIYKGLKTGIKSRKLETKNIDTIILDNNTYCNNLEYKNDKFKKIKNIIINNKKIPINSSISIQNTRAENIWFLNKENIGGVTYPITMGDYEIILFWGENADCNLKEINIIFPNKTEKIELNNEIKKIKIDSKISKTGFIETIVSIESKNMENTYYLDELIGIKEIIYNRYKYTKSDINNEILDLRNINKYTGITCEEMNVDTLIINKEVINNIYFKHNFTDKLRVNKLEIIDDNEMKLNPIKEIILDDKLIIKNNYLLDSKYTKVIFYDKDNNIKVIDKEELLKDELVEKVDFIFNSESDLVIIKYKNKEYKIIDKDMECRIDKIFRKFLLLNIDSYDFTTSEKPLIEINIKDNLSRLFIKGIIDNNLLYGIYKDYVEFIKRLSNLIELGFSGYAINYLINKKYENIINTKPNNILNLDSITEDEINTFNELGEKYERTKKLIKK